LAATISTDFNIVTLGRSPEAMARAVNRLLELRGGVVVVDGADVACELPLPLGGIMTRGSVEEAAGREGELREALVARGYARHEPAAQIRRRSQPDAPRGSAAGVRHPRDRHDLDRLAGDAVPQQPRALRSPQEDRERGHDHRRAGREVVVAGQFPEPRVLP